MILQPRRKRLSHAEITDCRTRPFYDLTFLFLKAQPILSPRFCRLRQYNILYICGTDEYGTASETKVRNLWMFSFGDIGNGTILPSLHFFYFSLHLIIVFFFSPFIFYLYTFSPPFRFPSFFCFFICLPVYSLSL